jgi:hypothetical protein
MLRINTKGLNKTLILMTALVCVTVSCQLYKQKTDSFIDNKQVKTDLLETSSIEELEIPGFNSRLSSIMFLLYI